MKRHNHNWINNANMSRYHIMMRFLLTWLLTIAILFIIFSRINFFEVTAILSKPDLHLFCAGILLSLLVHVLFSSARYQNVLDMTGCRVSFFDAVIIRMGCNPIKGILPFKVGELTILAYLKRKYNLSYPRGLLSLMSGYFFSFIILMFIFALGGILYFPDSPHRVFFAVLLLIVSCLTILLTIQKFSQPLAGYVIKSLKLPEEIKSFFEKYDTRVTKIILMHSLGIEGCRLLIILFLFKSLNIAIPVEALLFLGSLTILAAYLPVTYWGLGIRESAILFLFAGYAPADKLLAGSLLITFTDGLLPVLLGLFFVKPFLNVLLEDGKTAKDMVSNGE